MSGCENCDCDCGRNAPTTATITLPPVETSPTLMERLIAPYLRRAAQ